ncbi:ribose-phosphate diphosphokinase [Erythrobacter mangrovi]|uniref:Ribose-phosphate diphosphokinase n=1 Tax=Erythrobacter mangrovi TaxID=2739433 RepID=A0A7D4BC81_9SPHN|nr:ribose-phosphate diphosphokinase [Erythrobacter mangrovi]QKG72586.1 ribose-phosphate diphosphokinase [Erythrobacter mangrovi]
MTLILAFPGMEGLAGGIANEAGCDWHPIDLHRFPDGESLVTLPDQLAGQDVAILATLRDPDRLALQLLFAASTARDLGARSVGLAAPYMGYMRQDSRFEAGQAVSAPIFARFLEQSFDWVVTADPHLHRHASLDQLFAIPALRIEAAPLIAEWIGQNVPDAVLIGPDSESRQWVERIASLSSRPFEIWEKRRTGDRQVAVSRPDGHDRPFGTPVVVDDIVSTGHTMMDVIRQLLAAGWKSPVCVITHAVFADQAQEDLLASGAARIVSTDSIPHETNAISLCAPLARGIVQLADGARSRR